MPRSLTRLCVDELEEIVLEALDNSVPLSAFANLYYDESQLTEPAATGPGKASTIWFPRIREAMRYVEAVLGKRAKRDSKTIETKKSSERCCKAKAGRCSDATYRTLLHAFPYLGQFPS